MRPEQVEPEPLCEGTDPKDKSAVENRRLAQTKRRSERAGPRQAEPSLARPNQTRPGRECPSTMMDTQSLR